MRLGIVTDAHISPEGTRARSFHNGYAVDDALERYELALGQLVEQGAEALALLGDLSHLGDAKSLEEGLGLAAETGLPVWGVPGNHDVSERKDALVRAVRRVGSERVRLATPEGEAVGEGIRVAGLHVESEDWGFTSRSAGGAETGTWGDGAVVLLSHFPALSSRARVERTGLKYAGDLENLGVVLRPLLGWGEPTVVLSGHLHLRDAFAAESVLQLGFAALVEPPFEVSLVDVEAEDGRVEVRREAVALTPTPEGVRLPVLSPPSHTWAFIDGSWEPAGSIYQRRDIEMNTSAEGHVK